MCTAQYVYIHENSVKNPHRHNDVHCSCKQFLSVVVAALHGKCSFVSFSR